VALGDDGLTNASVVKHVAPKKSEIAGIIFEQRTLARGKDYTPSLNRLNFAVELDFW
jgi:hypothetical protein